MLRNQMTWMAALLGAAALTGMVGCSKSQPTQGKGSASITAASLLQLSDVGGVTVTISGGGLTTPLVVPLVGSGAQYGAVVSDLPATTGYVFTGSATCSATATDCTSGAVIYNGAATNVSIVANQTAAVIIDMNQVAAAVPVVEVAPVIDSLTASGTVIGPGNTATIAASGHDPNPGQTALMTWSWASTCGTVSAPTNTTGSDTTDGTSKVTFTAPTTGGVCVVDVTLTDAAGVLKNVASVAISVNAGAGNAKIVANLDTYPVITGLTATPIPLVVGTASTLTVTATDSDGNTLYYNWTSTCPGTFGTPTLATTTFIPSTTTLTSCTFSAVVNDGNFPDGTPRGGVITNSITLPIGGPTVVGAPVIGYDYQTSSTITTGQVVNMAIVATQGCSGGTLSFNWTASDHTTVTTVTPASLGLGTVFTTAASYTGQSGAENGPVITVTVTETCSSTGQSTSDNFVLIPLDSVCAGQPDGTNCTATASASNKCVLAASCQSGVCTASQSVACSTSSNTACQTNTCNTSTGACGLVNVPNNTSCTDNNLCTNSDVCTAGVCGGVANTPPSGLITDSQCQTASCNPSTGAWSAVDQANGTVCDDKNGCTGVSVGPGTSSTTPDSCQAGVCTAGPAVVCPSGDLCDSTGDATYTCPVKVCLNPSWAVETTPTLADMTSAASGTLWTAGSLYGSFNFGPGTITSTGSSDAYLNMVSPTTGAATQSFQFGDPGSHDQTASLVAAGQNGNVLVAGLYVSEIDFTANGSNGNLNTDYLGENSVTAGAPMNYWAVASASSAMPYVNLIYAHDADLGNGAFLAAASNPAINKAAICGKTTRAVGLSTTKTGFLSDTTAFSGQTDIVVGVVDLASTGKVVWGAQFGGTGNSQCTAIAMDASGNTYIAGNYNGSLSFTSVPSGGKTIALPTVSTSNSLALMFVAEFDANGNAVAAQTWGSAGISNINGIAVDGSGNVIVGGSIALANANFGGSVGTLTSLGLLNGFVVKLNNALTTAAWGFTFGDATFNQSVLSLATSSTGNVFIGGAFEGSLGAKLNGLTSVSDTSTSAFDAQLAAATGAVECAHSYGDASGNHGMNVVNVATAAAGSLANAVTYAGNFSGTMTLGNSSLNTPSSGTPYGFISHVVP